MKRKSERGFGTLISILIAAAILLLMLSALIPNTVRALQSMQAKNAALVLARINFAETASRQLYSGYLTPTALAQSNLSLPVSACNPELLSGADAQTEATDGYVFTFTPVFGGSATGCTPAPALVTSYVVTAAPVSKIAGQRYFYSDSSDVIRVNDGGPANLASPVYPTAAANGLGVVQQTQTQQIIQPSQPNPAPYIPPQEYAASNIQVTGPLTYNQFGTLIPNGDHSLWFSIQNSASAPAACVVDGVLSYTVNGTSVTEIVDLLEGANGGSNTPGSPAHEIGTGAGQSIMVADFPKGVSVSGISLSINRVEACTTTNENQNLVTF